MSETAATDRAATEFAGRRGRLFRLALGASLLTVLTLGLYRFWMKTRLRRWYWSAIRPAGLPLEYAGLPSEKLLGFLMAVVILAFYLGVVNLGLTFLSFAFFEGLAVGHALTFAGLLPLVFYARYRARRYLLARTRWRGIRFGMEPGAWGYVARALWHWFLAIITLGLLWPRKRFWLEKYLTDRTYFGTQPMLQEGRWWMLLPPFLPVIATVGASVVALLAALGGAGEGILALLVLVPLAVVALFNWQVASFRRLTAAKRAGPVRFHPAPRLRRVIAIHLFGGMAISLVALAVLVLFVLAAGLAVAGMGLDGEMDSLEGAMAALPPPVLAAMAVGVYFAGFILFEALAHAFLRMPLARHYAETLTLSGTEALSGVRQRGRDALAQAEGFADALDVGAAL
ncbi:MAG: DUF898 family protein [Alphaproteobacteria bacterium]|nr:MAG: DUF898 family protein [Alphaproteobacteria bacterium]